MTGGLQSPPACVTLGELWLENRTSHYRTAIEGGGVRQNRQATGFMLGAVLLLSLVPLVIVLGDGPESPFLFNAVWRLGSAVGCLLILLLFYRSVLLNTEVISLVGRSVKSWIFLGAVILSFDYALFSWSANFIDVSVSAILFELWPLLLIPLTAWLLREGGVYRKNIRSLIPFLVVAFVGLGFVVVSQTGGFNLENTSGFNLIAGVVLALLAAAAGACTAFTFRWGKDLADQLPVDTGSSRRFPLSLFGAVAAGALLSLVGAVLSAGIGFAVGEKIPSDLPTYLGYGLLGGVFIHAFAAASLRTSNLKTDNLGVNALAYLIPIFSLVWLALFLEIAVASVPYLVIGTAAIVTANLLVNFEAERLLGFKALVISLWACGMLVYLRDKASWGWTAQADGYFDILFLSATVFALILSFRTVRLASRTQEEDNRAFRLFRELEELERRGVILRWGDAAAFEHILTIDQKQGRELERAYTTARRALNDALPQAGPEREKLLTLSTELDRLAHSRQQGINFGEICALFIFAGLVVGTALLSRPAAVSGLTGFLVEMFAMLFPAVIIFLAFNVLDLQRDRVSRILKKNPEYGGYGVAFQDTVSQAERVEHSSRRTVEQGISIGVGGALIVAYAGLFLHKWGLWEQITAAAAGFLP